MIKYYCDLCGAECQEFTFCCTDIGDISIGVSVKASRMPPKDGPMITDPAVIELLYRRHLCNDCAIKAAGIALGFTPKPEPKQ